MVLDTPVLGARRWQVLGYVDEDAGLVRADLVDEDGRCVGEDDVAVVGHGELGVDHFEAPEFAAHLGLVGDVFFAELGVVAVGYEGYGAEVVVLLSRGFA